MKHRATECDRALDAAMAEAFKAQLRINELLNERQYTQQILDSLRARISDYLVTLAHLTRDRNEEIALRVRIISERDSERDETIKCILNALHVLRVERKGNPKIKLPVAIAFLKKAVSRLEGKQPSHE